MSIQLTPDQERRVQSFVDSGLYTSTQMWSSAALAAVEQAVTVWGEPILEGLDSGEPVEADESFWNRLRAETDGMVAGSTRYGSPILES